MSGIRRTAAQARVMLCLRLIYSPTTAWAARRCRWSPARWAWRKPLYTTSSRPRTRSDDATLRSHLLRLTRRLVDLSA